MEENTNLNIIEEVVENTEVVNNVHKVGAIVAGGLVGFAIGYVGTKVIDKLITARKQKQEDTTYEDEITEEEE